jgi:hypothetical protein
MGILSDHWARVGNFLELVGLEVTSPSSFRGKARVLDRFGLGEQELLFDEKTQTNDPDSLKLEAARAEKSEALGSVH